MRGDGPHRWGPRSPSPHLQPRGLQAAALLWETEAGVLPSPPPPPPASGCRLSRTQCAPRAGTEEHVTSRAGKAREPSALASGPRARLQEGEDGPKAGVVVGRPHCRPPDPICTIQEERRHTATPIL